jgi:hypothetical protein
MARPILQLQAADEELLELGRMARGTEVSAGDRFRAKIILLRLECKAETEVARTLGCLQPAFLPTRALGKPPHSCYWGLEFLPRTR